VAWVRCSVPATEGATMWYIGIGVFAVMAILVIWVGVSKMRRASRGE